MCKKYRYLVLTMSGLLFKLKLDKSKINDHQIILQKSCYGLKKS